MEKKSYKIRCFDRTCEVVGYVFSYGAHNFGVSNYTPDGKRGKWWYISELKTGCCIHLSGYDTRERALDDVPRLVKEQIKDFDGRISAMVARFGSELNTEITPKDVILCAR